MTLLAAGVMYVLFGMILIALWDWMMNNGGDDE
jgi:hypothetical protein